MINRWKQIPAGMTPGGTPMYVCANCGKSEHLYGVEFPRRKVLCKECGSLNFYPWEKVEDIDMEKVSDGCHTFESLYHQRAVLFATIVNQNQDKAWKSYKHEDGELCFGGGWFIVGVDTPEGSYTYHYENKYWDLFKCKELPYGKHWDGHTDKDVIRLLSLGSYEDMKEQEWAQKTDKLPF